MAKKRHRRSNRSRSRKRRSNPIRFASARRSARRSRRRRNPGGFSINELTGLMLWGTIGAVASRALPQTLLKTSNTGPMGWGANLLTGIVGGGLVGKFAGAKAGANFTAGGIIGTALRIFSDTFSTYASQFGLSGDLDFDLGFYIPNTFPLPTTGAGPYLLNAGQSGSPMQAGGVTGAIAVSNVAAGGALTPGGTGAADEPQRWGSRWAA